MEDLGKVLGTLLECPSTKSFPSAAVGITCVVECQLMRGHKGPHRALYMGMYPHEWTDAEADKEEPEEE